jgi:hypothetical protein
VALPPVEVPPPPPPTEALPPVASPLVASPPLADPPPVACASATVEPPARNAVIKAYLAIFGKFMASLLQAKVVGIPTPYSFRM